MQRHVVEIAKVRLGVVFITTFSTALRQAHFPLASAFPDDLTRTNMLCTSAEVSAAAGFVPCKDPDIMSLQQYSRAGVGESRRD